MTDKFDARAFLETEGIKGTIAEYRSRQVIYRQGDPCPFVFCIQAGQVKLSVVSRAGRQGVVALLGVGEFFGEGCLAGQTVRMGSATTIEHTTLMCLDRDMMADLLHQEHPLLDRFISHMLDRNVRIEQDLINQLFNSGEKRLARTLLLLARYGKHNEPVRLIPPISQGTLAEMVGTT